MPAEQQDIHARLCALLDAAGVSYRVVEHEAEGRSEMIAKIRGHRPGQAIKALVVQLRVSKKESKYVLANIPADCRLNLDAVRDAYSAQGIGMATRERAEEFTSCVPGAIPPFSFDPRLEMIADPRIRSNEEVVFNAGRLDRSIFMRAEDWERVAQPRFAEIAVAP